MNHPLPDTARPCPECDGTGTVGIPVCRGGYDHAGHDCGGRVCGFHEAECEDCNGLGAVPCSYCGEAPATVWDGRWGYCDDHRAEADHAA